MNIGEKIKKLRLEKGMTQKVMGELCSMPDSQIRQYESGKVMPKLEQIIRMATALGVDPFDDILNDKIIEKEVFDLEDEHLTAYIKDLGYSIKILDENYYILSTNDCETKITYKEKGELYTEIDDYISFKLEKLLKK